MFRFILASLVKGFDRCHLRQLENLSLRTLNLNSQATLVLPNLDFLEDLKIVLDKPISRKALVDTDLFSQENVRQTGIYAMGPLVGDNFVRFLLGGALTITNHILKQKHIPNVTTS